jgi:hypothetical protein
MLLTKPLQVKTAAATWRRDTREEREEVQPAAN